MEKIWYLLSALCLLQFHITAAAETYVSCLSCPDVASPRYCQQTMTCGKGEICFAKEYTDHRGLKGYRLGCEDEARCNLFLNAKQFFGKRNIPDTDPEMCYDCCSGDECNGRLCQGGGNHVLQPNQTTTSATPCFCPTTTPIPPCTYPTTTPAPPCLCPTTTSAPPCTYSPKTSAPPCVCPTTTPTPPCTYPKTTSAQPCFCPTTTPPPPCTYPTTTSAPPCVCPATHRMCPSRSTANICPDHFIQHQDRCYMFVSLPLNRNEARRHCKSQGADLVSINSPEEQDYLVKELILLDDKGISYYHTGGWFDQSSHEWEWVDSTPVQFTNWYSGGEGTLYQSYQYHIAIVNPAIGGSYIRGPWIPLTTNSAPFICEKNSI